MESQHDLTNLIPKGLGSYWFFFLSGSMFIALLEFAYFKMPVLTELLGVKTIPPLDVTLRGSLLNWGFSVLLLITAVVSLINFQLGLKYKDPRGRVNTWFWTAVVLIFLSLDVQVAVRETISDVLSAASGTSLYRDGTVWWLILYSFFFGVLGTRILLDMMVYAPSLGLYLLAVSGMVTGFLVEIGLIPIFEDSVQNIILQTAIPPSIALIFFLAVTLFARRQIFRDSEVALRWFAKIWQHASIAPATQTLSVTPPPSSSSKSSPSPKNQSVSESQSTSTSQSESVSDSKPMTDSKPASTANTASGTLSATERPLVQKTNEIVPFKPTTEKDNDFELADTA
ncbi:MAG: hypothetical protein LBF88_03755 [Planctomycetaceae bacterium]|jgi:hypothetical protein|nr:hypothetical protein [Planctomycetaceae bacterium]